MQFTLEDQKRMRWHSRRGMLELDLILVPFAEHELGHLSDDQLGKYQQLLAEEDQDLFGWFIRRDLAPSASLREIVELVLACRGKSVPGHS